MKDQIKSDINALIDSDPPRTALPAIEPVGGYPAQRGRSTYAAPQAAGGGISGPLTERPEARRRYGEAVVIPESGFFAYLVQPVRQMTFDSPGGELVVNFGLPDYMNPDYEVEL